MATTSPPACVILIGIPASGKSSFYQARFSNTHVRINRDMLRTAHRERLLAQACLEGGISFVVDKTNVMREERGWYIAAAKLAGFRVEGYFFQSRRAACIERNRLRPAEQRVPDAAVGGMSGRLELPHRDEGYDGLYYVTLLADGGFDVQEWSS